MRDLQFLEFDSENNKIICLDIKTKEKFLLPITAELLNSLNKSLVWESRNPKLNNSPAPDNIINPKEIQSRIRSGDSLEKISVTTNLPISTIEKYAFPILLEIQQAVVIAKQSIIQSKTANTSMSLEKIVANFINNQKINISETNWNASKLTKNPWIVSFEFSLNNSHKKAFWQLNQNKENSITPINKTANEILRFSSTETIPIDTLFNPNEFLYSSLNPTTSNQKETITNSDNSLLNKTKTEPDSNPNKTKRNKPKLPSWDEILLGINRKK